jgi:hypothetical protein
MQTISHVLATSTSRNGLGHPPADRRTSPVVTCGLVRLIAEPHDDSGWQPIGESVVEDVPPENVEQALALLTLEGHEHITQWKL